MVGHPKHLSDFNKIEADVRIICRACGYEHDWDRESLSRWLLRNGGSTVWSEITRRITCRGRQQGRPCKGTNLFPISLPFIEAFQKQGVPMQTLRRAAERARHDWNTSHPLALSKAKYLTDRRHAFAQVADEEKDRITCDMASGQHEMWDVIESTIAKGVEFGPTSDFAKRSFPLPGEFPGISVDPAVAFGKPALSWERIPAAALHRMWRAEGGNIDRVA